MSFRTFRSLSALLGTIALVTGCASLPQDGGIGTVEDIVSGQSAREIPLPRPEDEPPDAAELDARLAAPLSLEEAEKLAIDNHPSVRAMLARVGVAEADYAQAGRMENPGITYERYSSRENSSSILFDIGGVLLMPLRRQLEGRRVERQRYQSAADILTHVQETRVAWINAVAERQLTVLVSRALETLETSNDLMRQMSALGHGSVMESAQSELVLGRMRTTLNRQRQREAASREALVRQLGLWGRHAREFRLPTELPELPEAMDDFPAVEQFAIDNRLDVRMARYNLEGMVSNLKINRLNPFISAIELGPTREESGGEVERGYELELRLPIFDPGDVQNARARSLLEQASAQAQSTAVFAASAAREALLTYQVTWDIARHMEEQLLPLRARVSAEQMLRYNGMLISVFDLLRDLVEATTLESEAVNALREFWLADTTLQNVLTGTGGAAMAFAAAGEIAAADGGAGGH